jgi:hypothetical protein
MFYQHINQQLPPDLLAEAAVAALQVFRLHTPTCTINTST